MTLERLWHAAVCRYTSLISIVATLTFLGVVAVLFNTQPNVTPVMSALGSGLLTTSLAACFWIIWKRWNIIHARVWMKDPDDKFLAYAVKHRIPYERREVYRRIAGRRDEESIMVDERGWRIKDTYIGFIDDEDMFRVKLGA